MTPVTSTGGTAFVGHIVWVNLFILMFEKAADKHASTSSPSSKWISNIFYGAPEVVPSGVGLTVIKVLADDGGRINAVAFLTLTKEIAD